MAVGLRVGVGNKAKRKKNAGERHIEAAILYARVCGRRVKRVFRGIGHRSASPLILDVLLYTPERVEYTAGKG